MDTKDSLVMINTKVEGGISAKLELSTNVERSWDEDEICALKSRV